MKDVILNGDTYFGVSTINLATPDGSTAKFRDIDEAAGTMEVQTAKCDPELLASYGGMKIKHTPGSRCMYAGYPDANPGGTLVKDRFPWAVIVSTQEDDTISAAMVGWAGGGGAATVTLAEGEITISGNTTGYLLNTDITYTFYKVLG